MIIEQAFEQGSPEWHAARVGNPGATAFQNIITTTGAISKSRDKYLKVVAEEILEGVKQPTFKSYYMHRGTLLEPDARKVFEGVMEEPVEECGMIYPDERRRYHISPDGIMPSRGEGLEIKCPALSTHLEYLEKAACPTEYVLQVQGSLMVTGYTQWWFMSYFPAVKPLIIPVQRDEKLISILHHEMERFIADLDEFIGRMAA